MEGFQLFFQRTSVVLRGERALHQEDEALGEGDARRARGVQDVVLKGFKRLVTYFHKAK